MVYTHDSIGLGEDSPTHQSVEQQSDAARGGYALKGCEGQPQVICIATAKTHHQRATQASILCTPPVFTFSFS
ncbi:hypothetical protein DT73_08375 [Mangrovibacter sp. MFB070]|nr:hypothetical protein DT73_08375 [Mangrovibacter sp. MFB070]